jgi:hypothetical protein
MYSRVHTQAHNALTYVYSRDHTQAHNALTYMYSRDHTQAHNALTYMYMYSSDHTQAHNPFTSHKVRIPTAMQRDLRQQRCAICGSDILLLYFQ